MKVTRYEADAVPKRKPSGKEVRLRKEISRMLGAAVAVAVAAESNEVTRNTPNIPFNPIIFFLIPPSPVLSPLFIFIPNPLLTVDSTHNI